MANAGTIQAEFTLGNTGLIAGIRESEQIVTRGATNIQGRIEGLFRRTPGRRAERAFGNLLGDISTGNLTQGLAQFAGRLTGLGLAAGIGVGAAVEIFGQLHSSVVEVRKAHDELDRQMSKPLNLTSIEGLGKAIDSLREKQGTFTHGLTGFLSDIAHQKGFGGLTDLGKSQIEEEKEISAAIEKRQAAERLRGQDELVRANVLARLEADPKRKALAELRFKFDDRRKSLQSSPDKGSQQRLEALDLEQEAAEKTLKLGKVAEDARADAKERSLAIEEQMQKLIKGGLTLEDQKKVRTGLEFQNIEEQLKGKLPPEERHRLVVEKLKKENELRGFGKPDEGENPFAFGTIAAREFERQQDSVRLSQQPATFGLGSEEGNKKAAIQPTVDVKEAVDTTNKLLRKIFLTPASSEEDK